MSIFSASITGVLLSSGLSTSFFHDSDTLNQGDKIYVGDGGYCTIGWVNDDYAFTNAHCSELGAIVYDQVGNPIGTIVEMPDINTQNYEIWSKFDWAVIELNDNIVHTENVYSGNTMLTLDEIEEGDEICRYGATTQKVLCSNVVTLKTMISEGTVIADNYASAPGDSGGPVWSPEKGFIGLHKGESARSGYSVTTPILNIVPQKYL